MGQRMAQSILQSLCAAVGRRTKMPRCAKKRMRVYKPYSLHELPYTVFNELELEVVRVSADIYQRLLDWYIEDEDGVMLFGDYIVERDTDLPESCLYAGGVSYRVEPIH